MTLEQESRRGAQARRLLEDPLLQEAFATVENALREAWIATQDDATAERERLWLMVKLMSRVRIHLVDVLQTGRLADDQLAGLKPPR
jgi:ABC-type thiamine transport system ATPase subunit